MTNPMLSLIPMQGAQQTGQTINNAGNVLIDALRRNQDIDYRNQVFDAQQSNRLFNQGLAQTQADQQTERHQFTMDQEKGRYLYNTAVSLKSLTPEQRSAAIQNELPQLEAMGIPADVAMDGVDDAELEALLAVTSRFAPQEPEEMKVGRYRTLTTSDGKTLSYDSASGQIDVVHEESAPDISILPAGLQKLVENQPREIQENAIKTYTKSDAFLDRQEIAGKQEQNDKNKISKAQTVIRKIDQALSDVDIFTAGLGGAIMGIIPGTDAKDLNATVETVKANLGFDQLQAMREASPTGGALGQITERELSRLEAGLASLDTNQSPEALRRNLLEIRQAYDISRGLISGAYTVPETEEDYSKIPSGSLFVDPDEGVLLRKP